MNREFSDSGCGYRIAFNGAFNNILRLLGFERKRSLCAACHFGSF